MKTITKLFAALALLAGIAQAQPSPGVGSVTRIQAGTGISISPPSGQGTVTVTATAGAAAVNSALGTAGQVLVNGVTTAQTGNVTFSLPSALTGIQSITGVAGNMTIIAGTGASRAMILQTTTSGSTATTFLTGGADQSTTLAGRLIGSGALNAINVAAGVTPFVEMEVDSTSTSSPRGIMSTQFNTGTDGARFNFRKARGTRASPTTVVSGDNLGRLVGAGYDGTGYLEMASIYFATEGTIATNRVPTNIQFWTATDAGPSVLTLAGTINSAQKWTLPGALSVGGALTYGGVTFAATTTGSGSLVGSASPTFTGTVNAAAITASGGITSNGGNATAVTGFFSGNYYKLVENQADSTNGGGKIQTLLAGVFTDTITMTHTGLVTLRNSLTMSGTLTGAATLTGTNSIATATSTSMTLTTAGINGLVFTHGSDTAATVVADFTALTKSGTAATAAAILGKSLGLSENLYVGGTTVLIGNALGLHDDTYFGWDASSDRFGFSKKNGSQGKLAHGSGVSFVIARSSGITIEPSANTFTTEFTIDTSGNATLAGTTTSTGLLTGTAGVTTGAGVTNAAGTWKLGALRTGVALTPSTTNVIQVDIGGTLYSLLTATTNP